MMKLRVLYGILQKTGIFTILVVWEKRVFRNFNFKIMKTDNKANFLKKIFFNYQEQTSKCQYTFSS